MVENTQIPRVWPCFPLLIINKNLWIKTVLPANVTQDSF